MIQREPGRDLLIGLLLLAVLTMPSARVEGRHPTAAQGPPPAQTLAPGAMCKECDLTARMLELARLRVSSLQSELARARAAERDDISLNLIRIEIETNATERAKTTNPDRIKELDAHSARLQEELHKRLREFTDEIRDIESDLLTARFDVVQLEGQLARCNEDQCPKPQPASDPPVTTASRANTCPPCAGVAQQVADKQAELDAARATMQNIATNIATLTAALGNSAGNAARTGDIQAQLNRLNEAMTKTGQEATAKEKELAGLKEKLLSCKCPTGTTQNTDVNTTGTPRPGSIVEPAATAGASSTSTTPELTGTSIISRWTLQSSSDPFDRAVYEGGTKPSSSSAPLRRDTYSDGRVTYTDTSSGTTYTVTPNREGTFDVSYNGATMRVSVPQGGLETAARLLIDSATPSAATTTPRSELTPEQRAAIRDIMRPFAQEPSATDCTQPNCTSNTTPNPTGSANTTGSRPDPVVRDPPSLRGDLIVPTNIDSAEVVPDPPGTGAVGDPGYANRLHAGDIAVTGNAGAGVVVDTNTCSGAECSEEWNACTTTNSCAPIDRDCGVPGTCSSSPSDPPSLNLSDPSNWSSSGKADVETRIQIKIGDIVYDVVIRPVSQPGVGQWFNPLGWLAKRLRDNVERWHGSVGPRPLITPRDLRLVEKYTDGQNIGLPKGVHVLLTDRGGSTGKTLAMQVLNLTGQPVRLTSMPFVIEPIRQQAQQGVQQAFNRLAKAAPVNVDLAAYCAEFLKLPPAANQIFRLAPAAVQQKYQAMSKVLRSAYRVQHAGLMRPDSNPAAYTDSIKQWALWAVEQKLNETRFTEAFLGHTKKNVEAAGQPWSKPAEEMVRTVAPNRWRDILKVLQGAGVPVPQ